MVNLQDIAKTLDEAQRKASATEQISHSLTIEQAYEIQGLSLKRRYERGEKRIGIKMGFTSRAKMAQMGIKEMIWGRLTDGMLVDDGADIDFKHYVHPRVEPEVAFLLKSPLAGKVSALQAMNAVAGVACAMEIIDSRYKDFKFSLVDVVADNTSASGLVVGPWVDPATDVANLGMVMEIDGKPVQIGSTAAILGHPLRSLVTAARLASEAGERLEAGDIVMAGGATAAEYLKPGQRVRLSVERLGSCSFGVQG